VNRRVAVGLCLIGTLALGGCRAVVARFWSKAGINAHVNVCPDAVLAVGDSIQFHASIMISNAPGGMQGPFDNVTLYRSEEDPGKFTWSLSYPPPSAPKAQYYPIGGAEITKTGMLIAKDTGYVYVHVRGAGKNASRVEMRIVPRVTAFALHPHDTTIRVGDTLFLRADADLDGKYQYKFAWQFGYYDTAETRRLERVERDPDSKAVRDERNNPVVAVRPGTTKIPACFAGARRDTATITTIGDVQVANRDVPPRLRLSPRGDTSVYLGDEFHQRVRILNAKLGNGPYRWKTTTGDGTVYFDSAKASGVQSAFGFEGTAFVNHRYFVAGKYPVITTVTDSAGRSTTVRSTYTATAREFRTMVLNPEGRRYVRLDTAGEPDIAIVLLADTAKQLWPAHIAGAIVLTRMNGVPPLLFGRTVFDPELDGRRRVTKDVNGDGQPDNVFYLDKAMLRRNGDLHVGRNRIVVSGVIGQRIVRPDRPPAEGNFYPPVRAVVEFDAIP
jgi:hypothetical protein